MREMRKKGSKTMVNDSSGLSLRLFLFALGRRWAESRKRCLIPTTWKPQSHSSPASTYPFPHSVGSKSWKKLGRERSTILTHHRISKHWLDCIRDPIISYCAILLWSAVTASYKWCQCGKHCSLINNTSQKHILNGVISLGGFSGGGLQR